MDGGGLSGSSSFALYLRRFQCLCVCYGSGPVFTQTGSGPAFLRRLGEIQHEERIKRGSFVQKMRRSVEEK